MKIFSVIIPFYNVETYLEQCLESIENQTYPYFEVLLIDDGSSDRSSQIAQHFVEKDERFHLTKQKNQGPSVARNVGLKQAKGDYIVFIDGDDFVRADYLEALEQHITDEDMIVVDGFFSYQGKKNIKEVRDGFCKLQETLQTKELAVILGNCFGSGFPTWFCSYRRIFIEKNRIHFSPEYSWSEDVDFVMQALVKAEKGTIMPGCYYFYRLTMTSLTHQRSLKAWIDSISVLEKWFLVFQSMNLLKYEALQRRCSKLGNSCLLTSATLKYRERKQLWEKVKKNRTFLTSSGDKRCNMALIVYSLIGFPIGVKFVNLIWRICSFHIFKN